MSILLGALGAFALSTASIGAPLATINTIQPQTNQEFKGIVKIENQFLASHAKGLGGSNTLEKQHIINKRFTIPWSDLGLKNQDDYFEIKWREVKFTINATLSYQNNVWADSYRVLSWNQTFQDLDMLFSREVVYDEEDAANEVHGFGRSVYHKWSYKLRDTVFGITIDAKIWTSARNKLAESWATMSFDSMFYWTTVDIKNDENETPETPETPETSK